MVLIDFTVVLPDQVFERVFLLLGVRHRLRSRGELLDILLTLVERWLSLDAARFVAFGSRQAGLRRLL